MKSFKRALKWAGIVMGVLLTVLLLANTWFVWSTGSRLEGQLAAIRQAGQPLLPVDLTPRPILPEQNAATYLRRAETDMAATARDLHGYFAWSYANGAMLGQHQPLMSPEMQRTVEAAFDAHPELIGLLEQAAASEDYDAQLDYALPHEQLIDEQWSLAIQRLRTAAHILEARSLWLSSTGNRDQAVRTALLLLRLGHHADRNPMLAGYLIAAMVRGIAISAANTALQAGLISRDVHDALDAELARHEGMDGYERAVQSERVFMLDSFPDPVTDNRTRNFWLFSRAFWNRQESECLDAMQGYVALTRNPSPYRDTERMLRTLYEQCFRKTADLGKAWLPAADATHATVSRVRAYIRCLRVLNALQTHFPAGSNEVPKLSELGLPAETTTDPFTGDPLHIQGVPEGWLIYSVGRNFQDDGGTVGVSLDGDIVIGPSRSADRAATLQ